MKYTIVGAIAALTISLAACGESPVRVRVIEDEPTTTTSTTTPEPSRDDVCREVYESGEVSTINANDTDAWCDGITTFAGIHEDEPYLWCQLWYEDSDSEIIDFMYYDLGWDRDKSIGALDYLYLVC